MGWFQHVFVFPSMPTNFSRNRASPCGEKDLQQHWHDAAIVMAFQVRLEQVEAIKGALSSLSRKPRQFVHSRRIRQIACKVLRQIICKVTMFSLILGPVSLPQVSVNLQPGA